ncbi:serine/threonine-protein kinase [Bythopirellula goksoeyrii]|uniref:Serine/threonine-protein kinase PknD n=1 Tax=Bythopirellula goksoeyrii TaxID=1400387 RepID=A0A5B9QII9_9BACT|nr:serine/threonine-protein kinase [Bythopirellula goksoeyrii]QEG37819.1 Serine/threonine-protein kinase PknD [Bythopirellula goksoeyrii]
MAEEAEKTPQSGLTNDDRYDATLLFEPNADISRQEQDIALAAELLQSGLVNEREIAAAVSDWSMYGSLSLAQHLENRDLLTAEQIEMLIIRAATRIDRARQSIAGGTEMPAAGQSMLLATLERLDGSGRVAKLLGVTVAARAGENDAREMQGRYEIIRKLGQGGLGRVWLTRDVNLNRHVALKEISHGANASEIAIERFKHEAEITGRLDHPSIVPIYQLGEDLQSGRAFYTMRFLGRSTLQDSISEYHERREEGDEDPMLLRRLLGAFVNVCHAIGHAHSRKVIHRDLKPENVVIDNFGQVIVIDWGLAKVIDDASVESLMDSTAMGSADRTNEGQVLGTPLFMAPEQAAGRLDELDQRTDIYGLGSILFAIVTGYAPHEKTQKESIDSGVGARGMISTIASGVTPLARDVHANADPALEAICRKAMARRRYARYQSASELAEDVQRWMAGEPVTAYQETSWQRVNRWISQHQRLSQSLIGAAMVILVALTTLGMAARQRHQAEWHNRYSEMEGDVREVSLHLQGIAKDMSQDVRFLSSLPPIQGLVNALSGVEGESEDVWRPRLETIFKGMLGLNSDYLALSFEEMKGEGVVDLVRVERSPADPTLIRVLPESRRQMVETDELMNEVSTLDPGDVRLSLAKRGRHTNDATSVERFSAATPVYGDNSGECFGMTVIETDIARRIQEVLRGLGSVDCDIYIADGSGNLWASTKPEQGVRMAHQGETIPDLPKQVAEQMAHEGESFELHSEDEYVAQRFYIDPQARGVTIFARLPEE